MTRPKKKEGSKRKSLGARAAYSARPRVLVGEGQMAFVTAPTRNGSITMAMKHINTMDIVESL